MSRTATQILQELYHHVEPPQHVAIELIESFSSDANDPNWAAAMGSTDAPRNESQSFARAGRHSLPAGAYQCR
jgi:hypothetical protein